MKFLFSVILVVLSFVDALASRTFEIDYQNDTFLKDGVPFNYVSGSIHYARVPQYYWGDRLRKMYAAGLDAIQTYVPWNVHEPESGLYDFDGQEDLEAFLKLAQEIGLLAIVRAGPYMCGEWEFGGFPPWLLKENASIVLRSMDPGYIKPVDRWLGVLLPKLKPLLYENGGPIILTQLENEYGSFFTCDGAYMAHLRDTFRAHLGDKAVLITTDGAGLGFLKCGAVKGVYATVDFGPGNATNGFAPMRQWNPHGPLVNSEYYTGWLDHWGHPHAHGNTDRIVQTLADILTMNASVNFYMFEGGTNFGYMNGANAPFQPVPTSYDYDAPLTEAGDITSKYMAIRSTISKFKKLPDVPVPPSTPKYAYGPVTLKAEASLLDVAQLSDPSPVQSLYPLSMEQIGQNYGFVLYRHILSKDYSGQEVQIDGLRDRAYVTVTRVVGDGFLFVALLDRAGATSFNLVAKKGHALNIIVENMGRINFGKDMIGQNKGIVSNVTVEGVNLTHWTMYKIQLHQIKHLLSKLKPVDDYGGHPYPMVYTGTFVVPRNTSNVSHPMDTYISMPGWYKGQLMINGHNLGRYWPARGPQMTLYIPKGVLLPYPKVNQIIQLEFDYAPCRSSSTKQNRFKNDLWTNEMKEDRFKMKNNVYGADKCQVVFVDTPVLNGTTDALNVKQDHYIRKYGHAL